MIELGQAQVALAIAVGEPVWYIPHHGVIHPTKKKFRVVFDCSSQACGGSLNDVLLQGPELSNSLMGVLLRFGLERHAFMCDVAKMFYYFYVPQEQRNFLRLLWWTDGNLTTEPVDHRVAVHVFGAKSSSAVATYGLKRCAADRKDKYPAVVVEFIKTTFYVDDGLTS